MVITAVVAAATTIILYWPSLHLPIVYDTLQHIRISDDMTLATAWIPTDKFGFYRPFAFIPFILIREIFGGYPNWLLHGLNIAQHGLNVFLLVILAWRLGSSWARALVAGLLFALFPFSYRAIVIYGNNVYPFTIGLILLGLNTYLTAIKTQRPEGKDNPPIFQRSFFWWAVTGFIFLSGLFSHEMMVLFGLLAALVHFNDPAQPPLGSNAPALRATFYNFHLLRGHPWLLFLLVDIVYVIGYQFLPISIGPSEAITTNEGGLWVRAQYMLQAGAYPFTWTAHLLPNMTAKTIILGGTAVTLGLTLWAARRRENWRPLLLGWGWWGVASALVAIPLPTGYLLRGPRLLYLSSVGLGLAWATIVTGSLGHGTNGKRKSSLFNPKFLISTLFLAYVLMTNWQYIREKLADYVELTDPVAVMNEVMAERPSSEGVVLINLPQWLAPPRNSYAIGGEYVVMLGTHLFVEELIIANEGPQSVYSVVVPDLLGDVPYQYGLHKETTLRGAAAPTLPISSDWNPDGSQLFITQYFEDGLQTVHMGGFRPAAGGQPIASFGAYTLWEATGWLCAGAATTNLVWQQSEPASPTTSIFVQLLAEDGRLIAQADGPPLGLRPDLLQLAPGWEMTDRRTLEPTESGAPAQLLVGAYDFASGERAPAFDNQQVALPDNALRIPITPCLE